ncbi:MAG: iron-sulfur cluster-binding protein [Proteobacteria bacterium]|nr:iron-sulfur cluster-binding protein [Pseudomonadota bacterium]MBT6348585.1 iron-sulfur cluster-binding protein [Pseudomonadota bacterium]
MSASTSSQRVEFQERARQALSDVSLQRAMAKARGGFVDHRRDAVDALPEFDAIRDAARDIKDHVLANLDGYLELYEQKVIENGGQVHWARDADEACRIVAKICKDAEAKTVTKGKSMVSEEIHLNPVLEAAGMTVVETDLGEYIVQLAGETPSHIIAPAVHKTREQITDLFHEHHSPLGYTDRVTQREALVNEARSVLRERFVAADVGITGANFLVAETGANVIVTNEGNGDLTSCLPRVHIVTAGIEKVIPSLDDLSVLLRVLARSATGQEFSAYTSLYSGPRRTDEMEGPEAYHVVLLDNGRSRLLGGQYQPMLRCIRCGACLNHCPVYGAIGGHAYGWVYSGPMGSVLTPLLNGFDQAMDLPNACTLNGRCKEVCPVRIPLSDLLLKHRLEQHDRRLNTNFGRFLLSAWAWLARRPRLYQGVMALPLWLMHRLGKRRGVLSRLPGLGGWTDSRDFPIPARRSFLRQWHTHKARS